MQPIFTIQGRLTENGVPVDSTISANALIRVDGVVITNDPIASFAVVDGLFTAEVPLPPVEQLDTAGVVTVQLIDAGGAGPIGAPITITHTPRAWTARYAASAGSAVRLANETTVALTPSAPFANYPGEFWGLPKATRQGGMVVLSGLLLGQTATPDTTVVVLPDGFRPERAHIFGVNANSGSTRVDVYPDGRVVYRLSGSYPGWIPLDGIAFPVAE